MAGHIIQFPTGSKQIGQPANRRFQVWEEIPSGRRWTSTVDKKDNSQAPASPLDAQFKAPVIPPSHYVQMKTGADVPYGKVVVNYDQWIGDLEQSWTDRQAAQDRLARAISAGDETLYGTLMANPSPMMLGHLGPSPLNPKYALACQAGDHWALGLDPWDGKPETMPKWAQKLWPDGVLEPARQKVKRTTDFLYENDEGDDFPRSAPMRPRQTKGRQGRKVAVPASTSPDTDDIT